MASEQDYFGTYRQVTLSLHGVGSEIHKAFSSPAAPATPEEGLPAMITREQYSDAQTVPYLSAGIEAAIASTTQHKSLQAFAGEITGQQAQLAALSENIRTRQQADVLTTGATEAMTSIEDFSRVVEGAQLEVNRAEDEIAALDAKQDQLTSQHASEWAGFEKKYAESVVDALQKQDVTIDPNLVTNVIGANSTTDQILGQYENAGFTVPEELQGKDDVHSRMMLKTRYALLKEFQGKELDPDARDKMIDDALGKVSKTFKGHESEEQILSKRHESENKSLTTERSALGTKVEDLKTALGAQERTFNSRLGAEEQHALQQIAKARGEAIEVTPGEAPVLGGRGEG